MQKPSLTEYKSNLKGLIVVHLKELTSEIFDTKLHLDQKVTIDMSDTSLYNEKYNVFPSVYSEIIAEYTHSDTTHIDMVTLSNDIEKAQELAASESYDFNVTCNRDMSAYNCVSLRD